MKRRNFVISDCNINKWNPKKHLKELLRIIVLFCMSATVFFATVHAQTDADFSAYCRENFPGSIYQAIPQNWGIEHACNQGGTRQGINFSEACRMTTGSPEHEVLGARVICSGQGTDITARVQQFAGTLDVAAYCRGAYPNSVYEKRNEPTGVEHYCRQPGATGGFTLQNVDLAAACEAQRNVSNFEKIGAQVMCLRSGGGNLAGGDGAEREGVGGGGGGAGGSRKFPPLKPEDIIDAKGTGELFSKAVKYVNLQGCGNGDPEFTMKLPPTPMPIGRADQIYDRLGFTMPCPGLTGGKVITFKKYCSERNPEPMELRTVQSGRQSGMPICWSENQGNLRRVENVTPNISLTGVCQHAYFGQVSYEEIAKAGIIPLIKYQIGSLQAECFYIKSEAYKHLLQNADKLNNIVGSDENDKLKAEKGKDLITGGKGNDEFNFSVREDHLNTLDDEDRISDYEFGEKIILEGVGLSGDNIKIVFDAENNKTRIELDIQSNNWLGEYDGIADKSIILDGDRRGKLQIDANCCSNKFTEIKITETE